MMDRMHSKNYSDASNDDYKQYTSVNSNDYNYMQEMTFSAISANYYRGKRQ